MSETVAFNLINAPWLPVRRRSGVLEHIQPWRVIEGIAEDPFVAFAWPRPDFNGAAHEFMIGLLSTAAAPEDDEEWGDWWHSPPPPEMLAERFERIAHAFDLDGPGPRFLQDIDVLRDGKTKHIAQLLIDTPGESTKENNTDLFVKRDGVPALVRAAAAMALYTMSAYAPEGGAGHMTSLRGGGPMTTLVVADHAGFGASLWGRLWPNVETDERIRSRWGEGTTVEDRESVFPWLVPTRISNRKVGGRPTTPADIHPLQVYWGMPRRIRLVFEDAHGQPCGLTGLEDAVVVRTYRSSPYGIKYSEGFEHPLTPHSRKKSEPRTFPVHVKPGGITYRLWPSIVVQSGDKLRDPAQVVRDWPVRVPRGTRMRLATFGYYMAKMNPRAWVENEMPLWFLSSARSQECLRFFILHATAGAEEVSRLLTSAVKTALHSRPSDATGDYGFIAERFYRETEGSFYAAMEAATAAIQRDPDGDDPTISVREMWAPTMAKAALRLFDEHVPMDGLEDRNMHRCVKARFFLALTLGGRGKSGRQFFERALGIASPEPAKERKTKKDSR